MSYWLAAVMTNGKTREPHLQRDIRPLRVDSDDFQKLACRTVSEDSAR